MASTSPQKSEQKSEEKEEEEPHKDHNKNDPGETTATTAPQGQAA